ncbi:MAG TPA: hypothetical protein VLC09_20105 [Polyangiaceae bacterium]|nr:hypothetical protein [Polyangiaceae bacterium]
MSALDRSMAFIERAREQRWQLTPDARALLAATHGELPTDEQLEAVHRDLGVLTRGGGPCRSSR